MVVVWGDGSARPAALPGPAGLEAAPIGAAGAQRPGAEGAKSGGAASFDLSSEMTDVTYPLALYGPGAR